uniref:C2H2-type domain-containing protein n=1 Tax=Psilocybe cubensis TaxID=181762 RepID=A0A8H7XWX7_PSICU
MQDILRAPREKLEESCNNVISGLVNYDLHIVAARYARYQRSLAIDDPVAQKAAEMMEDSNYVVELELCHNKDGKPQRPFECRLCGYRAEKQTVKRHMLRMHLKSK